MRQVKTLNNNWYFSKTAKNVEKATLKEFMEEAQALLTYPGGLVFRGCSDWVEINLPHTWNGRDGQDGGNDYHRGTCYYLKNVPGELLDKNKINYLEFEGVNSSAAVFWNGKKVMVHHGGYSAFRGKIDDVQENNLLIVTADNAPNDFVYPQNADFTFYGGIYRDVNLISVEKNHFSMDDWGAPGIKVTPLVDLDKKQAWIRVESFVDLEEEWDTLEKNIKVRTILLDREGNILAEKVKVNKKFPKADCQTKKESLEPVRNSQTKVARAEFVLDNPHLWNGLEDPYLYTAKAELIIGEEVCDSIETRFGCRKCEIDADRGFILNGKEYPLRGVSRHQDRPEVGNEGNTGKRQISFLLL